MNIQKLMLVSSAILMAGCATRYQAPKSGDPSANITFEKGYRDGLKLGESTGQSYDLVDVDGCSDPDRIVKLSWANKKQVTKPIAAGKRISISATNTNTHSHQFTLPVIGTHSYPDREMCNSRVWFTPVEGETYLMSLIEVTIYACRLELKNTRTGQTPKDAVIKDNYKCT